MSEIYERKKIRKVMWRLFASQQWFMTPKALFHIMRPMEALVLSYLINVCDSVSALERKDRMFWVRNADICAVFNITEESLRTYMRALESKGFIKTKMKGLPAKRYVRINLNKVMRMVGDNLQPVNEAQT